jgi:hypothetical protein
MLTLKQPNPEVKPATHWGCGLVLISGNGVLGKATLLGKASASKGVNPLLRAALIFIIFCAQASFSC